MTFIFHPACIQYTSYCAKAKPCPAHARASGLEPSGPALRTAAHALKALCLYCVTGDEPSPDVLTRPLESNRKFIRIPLPRGTWRSIARRVRNRAATASAGLSSAAQPSPHAQILPDAGRNYAPARARFQCLDGNPRVCLRGVRKGSRRRANLEHSIPVARPTRFLSFWAAHANARGSFRGHDAKFVQMHKPLLARFGNPCDLLSRSSGITPSPHNENKEEVRKKEMSTDTKKATAAGSETMDEVFHEAMRSYEKALKSGIQLQEESVNLWKDLLTKLGSAEELQAKLESMTADAFPKARKRMEEFVETFNRTSNQTIDLFEKTLGVYQATSVTDAQRRVQDLVESSLNALRVNVHSALNTNAKIIASWKELVDRFGPPVKIVPRAIQAVVEGSQLGDLSTLEDYTALEGLKSVVTESKLQELRNEVRNRAFAIWLGRVQGGEGSHFGDASSDWFTARNELGIPPDLLL